MNGEICEDVHGQSEICRDINVGREIYGEIESESEWDIYLEIDGCIDIVLQICVFVDIFLLMYLCCCLEDIVLIGAILGGFQVEFLEQYFVGDLCVFLCVNCWVFFCF